MRARERTAKKADKVRHGAIKKRAVAAGLKLRGETSAEIDLDHRPPERPELIGGGCGTIGVSEHARVLLEFLGALERQE